MAAAEADLPKVDSAFSTSRMPTRRPTDSGDFDNDEQDEALIPCHYIQLIKREDVDQSHHFQKDEKDHLQKNMHSRVQKYDQLI